MLPDSLASLVRRDAAIPGLATLLNPEAFLEALSPFAPGVSLVAARPTYIRYKPGMNCLVAYELSATGLGQVAVYAKAHGKDERTKLQKAASPKCAPSPFGPGRLALDNLGVVVSFFPNDSGLKRLRQLSEGQVPPHLLDRFLPDVPDRGSARIETLAYKPERRLVAQLCAPSGKRLVLKFYLPRTFPTTLACARAFKSSETLKIPELQGKSKRYSVLALEWLDGQLLSDFVGEADEKGSKAVWAAGAALAALHSQEPSGLLARSRETEVEWTLARADWLSIVEPKLARQARNLAVRLASWLSSEPLSSRRPIHGDFYAKQVLCSNDKAQIVDLDEAAIGDPRSDLALFVAHLELEAVRGNVSADIVPELTAALLEGYRKAGAQVNHTGIERFIAVELFRLAHGPFRKCEPEWRERTEAVLDRAETIMANSKPTRSLVMGLPNGRPAGPSFTASVTDRFDVAGDEAMPFIRLALEPGIVAPLLTAKLDTQGPAELMAIRVVRHKPNRRCLIEYVLRAENPDGTYTGITWLGKARARGLDTTTYRVCEAFWNQGFDDNNSEGVSVAEPIGMIPEFQMWLQRKSSGRIATELLLHPVSPALACRIADAIHGIHEARIPARRQHSMAGELHILRERLSMLYTTHPEWAPRLESILERCNRLGASITSPPPVGIHRDFYPDQVIVERDRLCLIDFDLYCMGDPSLDIGNFNGHLIELSLRTFDDPNGLKEPEEVLKDRFLNHGSGKLAPNVEAYTTLTLVRHIHISTLFPDRQALTGRLIDLCEERLGLGSAKGKFLNSNAGAAIA